MQNKIIALVAVVALALGGFALYKALNIQFPLGAGGAGSNFYSQFLAGIQTGSINYSRSGAGGSSLALTGSTTSTSPTAAQICSNAVITWGVTEASATVILPSYANMKNDCLKNLGDTKRLMFFNSGTATTSLTVFTAGASSTLDYVGTTTLSGLNLAEVVFTNLVTTNGANMMRVLVIPGQL